MESAKYNRSYVDGLAGRQLSWALFQEEHPEMRLADWDDTPHPLALELDKAYGRNGFNAWRRWVQFADIDRHPVSAVVKWMLDGGFKGVYSSDAAFCAAHFGPFLTTHLAQWKDAAALGFPRFAELTPGHLEDLYEWDEWAGMVMNRRGSSFFSLPDSGAVFVFDVSGNEYAVNAPTKYVE